MQISIILTNLRGNTKILLDDEKKSCTVNGEEKNVNVDKVASRLLRIVSSWEDSYINPLIIDGLTYEVKIIKDLRSKLLELDVEIIEDNSLEGAERFYLHDPFGNRLEFLEWL